MKKIMASALVLILAVILTLPLAAEGIDPLTSRDVTFCPVSDRSEPTWLVLITEDYQTCFVGVRLAGFPRADGNPLAAGRLVTESSDAETWNAYWTDRGENPPDGITSLLFLYLLSPEGDLYTEPEGEVHFYIQANDLFDPEGLVTDPSFIPQSYGSLPFSAPKNLFLTIKATSLPTVVPLGANLSVGSAISEQPDLRILFGLSGLVLGAGITFVLMRKKKK